MIRIIATVTLLLLLETAVSAQVTAPESEKTSETKPAAAKPDPLALPFPTDFPTIRALGVWSIDAQSATHFRMVEARKRGDRAEVARLVTRLDKARRHAARMLEELKDRPAPRT